MLPNLAANPELAMTRAVTGAIDNIIGAVSSYRKMIIDDEREAEREQEKLRIELERQSAEGAADWYRENSLRIRQIEEGLRTQQITKEQANEGLDTLIEAKYPKDQELDELDQRTLERIQDAVRSDYDTFMVIGAEQEKANRASTIDALRGKQIQQFKTELAEEEDRRAKDMDEVYNLEELGVFREIEIDARKLDYEKQLREMGLPESIIKAEVSALDKILFDINYTDEVEWRSKVNAAEVVAKSKAIQINILNQLNDKVVSLQEDPSMTPNLAISTYDQEVENLYNSPEFTQLSRERQFEIKTGNATAISTQRRVLKKTVRENFDKTLDGVLAQGLDKIMEPEDGGVYNAKEMEEAVDGVIALHDEMNTRGLYRTKEDYEKSVDESLKLLEIKNADRALAQGKAETLKEELLKYGKGMYPYMDSSTRKTKVAEADRMIGAGDTRRTAVARQTIEDHLSKAVATGTPIEMELIAEQVEAGNIPKDLASGYMAEAEYIKDARDYISEAGEAGGLESMSDFDHQIFLEKFEPFKREEGLEEKTIFTERQVKHYNAFKAQIATIQKARNADPAGFAHAYLQKDKGSTKGVFDSDVVDSVFKYQRRYIPEARPMFIPKQTVDEFNELWKQGGQQGQDFDGVSLRGNLAIDRGLMAARIDSVKVGNYSALEEMAKRTGLDPMVLDLYAKFTNANELRRLERLDTAANLKEVAALKREIGGTEKDVNSELKDVFSDTGKPEGEDYQNLLGLYAGNPQAQANLRSLAEKYVLIQKQNGASYTEALGTFVDDMQSTIDGQIVNAAKGDGVQMSMILPNEHFKNADPNEVAEVLVDSASKIAELPRDRMNLENLPKDQRDRLEQAINIDKALIQNGEVSYAFQNVKGGFQLVAFTGGVYTPLDIGITYEEVKELVARKAAEPSFLDKNLAPFGGSYGRSGTSPEAGPFPVYAGQERSVSTGKKRPESKESEEAGTDPLLKLQRDAAQKTLTRGVTPEEFEIQEKPPTKEKNEAAGQAGFQIEGGDPSKFRLNRLYRGIQESRTTSASETRQEAAFSKKYPPAEKGNVKITKERVQYVADVIEDFTDENKIPIELILSIVATESSFDPESKGKAGEVGLMQMTKESAYADIIEKRPNFGYSWEEVSDPKNLEAQLMAGMTYFLIIRDHYGSIEEYGLTTTADFLMAYNGGPRIMSRKGSDAYKRAKVYSDKVQDNHKKYIKPYLKPYLKD